MLHTTSMWNKKRNKKRNKKQIKKIFEIENGKYRKQHELSTIADTHLLNHPYNTYYSSF